VIKRISILSLCLLLGAAVIAKASRTEQVPPREPLANFPLEFGSWRGQNTEPFSPEILAVLGADDYLSRVYQASRASHVGLYIGYYESQRQGDTIHSPLNCLPGAGWQPLSKSYIPISVVGADNRESTITVNRYVIEKGLERQVVLYWYQSHGRAIANEYRSKIFMVYDAVRLNRSDAALVRVMSPALGGGESAETAADARTISFVKAMFPLLERFLPS
jgi:EpsI family protein